jgi:hypothetical protein
MLVFKRSEKFNAFSKEPPLAPNRETDLQKPYSEYNQIH